MAAYYHILTPFEISIEDSPDLEKQFIGKKPNTKYIATTKGKEAFQLHILALEKLVRNT